MAKTVKKGSKIDDFRVPIFMHFGGPTLSQHGMAGMAHGEIPSYHTGGSWVWPHTVDHPRDLSPGVRKEVQKGVPKMGHF